MGCLIMWSHNVAKHLLVGHANKKKHLRFILHCFALVWPAAWPRIKCQIREIIIWTWLSSFDRGRHMYIRTYTPSKIFRCLGFISSEYIYYVVYNRWHNLKQPFSLCIFMLEVKAWYQFHCRNDNAYLSILERASVFLKNERALVGGKFRRAR